MPRDYRLFCDDIIAAIERIESYTKGLTNNGFKKDSKTWDAVIRNLQIIGEAVKKIPPDIRAGVSEVDWRRIGGLRDILVHEYFGIDSEIVWDVVQNKLPLLLKQIKKVLGK